MLDHPSLGRNEWTTSSLCPNCYRVVPASASIEDDGVYLDKICAVCGAEERALIERCPDAYRAMHRRTFSAPVFHQRFNVTILPVTDRCNVSCPHCYHMPGATPDPSIDQVVGQALQAKGAGLMLMGAEPTVRSDLPDLVAALRSATGKDVHIYTNAVRLADAAFVDQLARAGLVAACVSLHTSDYLGDTRIWEKKLDGIANLDRVGIIVEHISFSVRSYHDIPAVLRAAHPFWKIAQHFRIRVPGRIGTCATDPLFLSDFLPALEDVARAWGWSIAPMDGDNNPYHIWLNITGKPFRIIRWPDVHEVDLGELRTPPRALFVPQLGEVNFVHAALVQAALKTGKIASATFGEA